MAKTYTVDAKAYDEMARTTVELLRVHADLKHKYIDALERLAFSESREVCTVAHDGDVTTCGYCQRDELARAMIKLRQTPEPLF